MGRRRKKRGKKQRYKARLNIPRSRR